LIIIFGWLRHLFFPDTSCRCAEPDVTVRARAWACRTCGGEVSG
jgi:hypothetical protein